MLDIGWSELLLVGVVALIVVGPKDLPVMFHSLGRLTAKARSMAREFSRAMEDAAKETGLDGVSKDLKDMTSKKNLGISALERATEKFEKWEPKLPGATKATESAAPAAAPEKRVFEPDPELLAELEAAELEPEAPETPAPAPAKATKPRATKPKAEKTTEAKPKAPRKTAAKKAPAKKADAPKDEA